MPGDDTCSHTAIEIVQCFDKSNHFGIKRKNIPNNVYSELRGKTESSKHQWQVNLLKYIENIQQS